MSEGSSDLYVVVTGTAFDGLDIHGPFTQDDAMLWAFDNGQPYEVVCLHEPSSRRDLVKSLMEHLTLVVEAEDGDSNDEHIEALEFALEDALSLLGIKRPKTEVDDDGLC